MTSPSAWSGPPRRRCGSPSASPPSPSSSVCSSPSCRLAGAEPSCRGAGGRRTRTTRTRTKTPAFRHRMPNRCPPPPFRYRRSLTTPRRRRRSRPPTPVVPCRSAPSCRRSANGPVPGSPSPVGALPPPAIPAAVEGVPAGTSDDGAVEVEVEVKTEVEVQVGPAAEGEPARVPVETETGTETATVVPRLMTAGVASTSRRSHGSGCRSPGAADGRRGGRWQSSRS